MTRAIGLLSALLFAAPVVAGDFPLLPHQQPPAEREKLDPFDFVGPHFLGFYVELAVLLTAAAVLLRRRLRGPHDEPPAEALRLDPYEAAYLAGGETRALHAAVTGLVERGLLEVDPATRGVRSHSTQIDGRLSALELSLVRAVPTWEEKKQRDLPELARPPLGRIASRLEALGLIPSARRARLARSLPCGLLLALTLFGAAKIAVGVSRHRPVGFLVALTALTAGVSLVGFGRPVRRTGRGDRLVNQLAVNNAALHTTARAAPDSLRGNDLALAVGLFGLGAFTGGVAGDLRTTLEPPATHRSAYGCGSSCGGGGCGGGGCGGGGCGGCGGG